ncbi:choice-of-anchor A family protein [Microbacterium sp. 4R-513]|uniref:choice-of-anchor A family protein n=1 Tax=Microbacterium sp. 4R-513 TaxID=2567934 RepID=UPI0013E19D71|nr:choice-of-anchor A family protein [Microbacterium sp. 4R-513]QIG38568.1 choice-of-anchor A family protein [Microbacterium sp. 4R-513]
MSAAALVAVVGVIGGLGISIAGQSAAPDRADAAVGECPPGSLPGPGNDNPVFTDDNVAVYAGAFRVVPSAAEAEGLVVVRGDAEFAGDNETVNVGSVGVGSGVTPSPGDVMLAVGGALSVGAGTVLDVGANAFEGGELLGGSVQVGGATDPDYELDGSRYRLNNGTLTQDMGADAIAPWATWGTDIVTASIAYAALTDTGTAAAAFGRITFTGDGTTTQQVFTVPASALNATTEVAFEGIPEGTSVIINIAGTDAVTWAPNYFQEDGVRVDDPASPLFGTVAERTLWNFTQSSAVHIAGSSQVLGTILVPAANADPATPTLTVTASTNGRLYTNGLLLMDGVGNEHHNYPFLDAPFDCVPVPPTTPAATGSVSITKALSDEDAAILPPDAMFHGIVTCADPGGGTTVAEWAVAPGDTTVVDGLIVGSACLVAETIGVGARAYALPIGQAGDATTGFTWTTPFWDPSPPAFVIEEGGGPQIAFTVTNAIVRGAFTIAKVVEGDDPPPGVFAGTWSCELPAGTVVGNGPWSLAAGAVTDPIAAPVGATCAVTETDVVDPADGSWADPVIAPASVVITAGSAEAPLGFTVTNGFVASPTPGGGEGGVTPGVPGGTLPATGGLIAWGAVGAGILLVLGGAAVLTVAAVRRRRG